MSDDATPKLEDLLQQFAHVDIASLTLPVSLAQAKFEIDHLQHQLDRQKCSNRRALSGYEKRITRLLHLRNLDARDHRRNAEDQWERLRHDNQVTREEIADLRLKSRLVSELSQQYSALAMELAIANCEASLFDKISRTFSKFMTAEIKTELEIESAIVDTRKTQLQGKLSRQKGILDLQTKRLTNQFDEFESVPDEGLDLEDEAGDYE